MGLTHTEACPTLMVSGIIEEGALQVRPQEESCPDLAAAPVAAQQPQGVQRHPPRSSPLLKMVMSMFHLVQVSVQRTYNSTEVIVRPTSWVSDLLLILARFQTGETSPSPGGGKTSSCEPVSPRHAAGSGTRSTLLRTRSSWPQRRPQLGLTHPGGYPQSEKGHSEFRNQT